MLIHPWDAASREEWRDLLSRVDFGQVIAVGPGDDYPVVVPTHFLYDGADEIWFHLARPNPVWPAIEANPRVVLAVIADYTYIEAAWNADDGVPPEHGVPTSYYSAVQLRGTAEIIDDPEAKYEILARQLDHFEPGDTTRVTPSAAIATDRRLLPGIRGVRMRIESVQAKMKYGGNKPPQKRNEIAQHLALRRGPLDEAARKPLLRRSHQPDQEDTVPDSTLTTEQMHQLMPMCGHLGVDLVSAAAEEVVGALTWGEHLTTMGGTMHGGALMTLADAVGGICGFLNLPDGAQTSTTSSSTVFVRGARDGVVTATARPLHVGRSTIAIRVDVTDRTGRLVAQTTQSQAVLAQRTG